MDEEINRNLQILVDTVMQNLEASIKIERENKSRSSDEPRIIKMVTNFNSIPYVELENDRVVRVRFDVAAFYFGMAALLGEKLLVNIFDNEDFKNILAKITLATFAALVVNSGIVQILSVDESKVIGAMVGLSKKNGPMSFVCSENRLEKILQNDGMNLKTIQSIISKLIDKKILFKSSENTKDRILEIREQVWFKNN